MRRSFRRLLAGLAVLLVVAVPAAPAQAQPIEEGLWWHVQWEMDRVWPISDGSGVTVAVLDTGVDASVPELAGAVVPGTDLTGAGTDGTVDLDREGNGHGTQVASLIAGRGGNLGFVGVAPGARILGVTAGHMQGSGADVARTDATAIRYAVDHGADVINMSFTTPGPCRAELLDAIRYAADNDVIVVAGSGNIAGGLGGFPGNCPGVLTVGATDRQLNPWRNTLRSEHVDVAAGGVDLVAIGRGGDPYRVSGTSIATALVSGAIALVRAQFPNDSADQILRRIFHTIGDIHTPGRDDATGYGVVQPYYALTESLPPDAPNPIYDELYAATGDAAQPPQAAPTMVPDAAASGSDNSDQRATLLLLTIGIGLLFLAIAVGGIVIAVTLGRSRRPTAHPGPHPQPPPYYPGAPPSGGWSPDTPRTPTGGPPQQHRPRR